MQPDAIKLSPARIWILAARPKTLPAAAAPVLLGAALALSAGRFDPIPALAALAGALLIQIGTNFANDYFDFKQGADTHERLGPTRVTQAGLISPEQVARGIWAAFGLATLIGLYLVSHAGWPVLLIGVFSLLSGLAYTGGPFPLGYNGLGDLFVFIFFGLVAVGGTYYVQALTIDATVLTAATTMGFLSTAILVVNNLRDVDTDRASGKRTLAVRIGREATRYEYLILVAAAFTVPAVMVAFDYAPPAVLVTLAGLVRAVPLVRTVFTETGRPLNAALAGTGRLELEFALLFSVGLIFSLI